MVSEQGAQSGRDSDLRAELSLRPERPPVMRLSRKVLMGLAAIAAITVSGALIWALYQGRDRPGAGGELYNTENKTTPDGLSTLLLRIYGRCGRTGRGNLRVEHGRPRSPGNGGPSGGAVRGTPV